MLPKRSRQNCCCASESLSGYRVLDLRARALDAEVLQEAPAFSFGRPEQVLVADDAGTRVEVRVDVLVPRLRAPRVDLAVAVGERQNHAAHAYGLERVSAGCSGEPPCDQCEATDPPELFRLSYNR